MTYTKEETRYYNIHRINTCKVLDITINQYNYIRRIANDINTLDVASCNGEEWARYGKYDIALNLLLAKLENYLTRINKVFHMYHQSDPRGASLYLSMQEIDKNNYNATAECIY